MSYKDYIIPFIFTGMITVIVKYCAENVADTRIAGTMAVFPIGLLTAYFINETIMQKYCKEYTKSLTVYFLSGLIFFILITQMKMRRNKALLIAMIFWFIFTLIKLFFINFNIIICWWDIKC